MQNSIFVPSFIKFLKSVTLPSTFATSASLAKLREIFFATSNSNHNYTPLKIKNFRPQGTKVKFRGSTQLKQMLLS